MLRDAYEAPLKYRQRATVSGGIAVSSAGVLAPICERACAARPDLVFLDFARRNSWECYRNNQEIMYGNTMEIQWRRKGNAMEMQGTIHTKYSSRNVFRIYYELHIF